MQCFYQPKLSGSQGSQEMLAYKEIGIRVAPPIGELYRWTASSEDLKIHNNFNGTV